MPLNDPFLLIAAWILLLVSLYYAGTALRRPVDGRSTDGTSVSDGFIVRNLLLPLGFALFGLRWLLMGYGQLHPSGWGSRILFLLAVLGILGGLAAMRIRRIPD